MMSRYFGWISFVLFSLLSSLVACSGSNISPISILNGEEPEKVTPQVVYGSDDRMDFYQIANADWQERAGSTVALISRLKVVPQAATGGFEIKTSSYGKSMGLCASEPFYDQVTSAFCSGSLIAPDLILTAGHCLRNQKSCEGTKFVFNYSYKSESDDPRQVGADDVYSCKELIHTESTEAGNSDFAIVRLDRAVVGRHPLRVRKTGRIELGDPLVVIGYPSGLPLKLAGQASVRSNYHRYYFTANLDTYGGNSGSAVFNDATGEIEGILVRGEQDFAFKNGCYVTNVCPEDGCRGEDVTRVSQALRYIDPAELP